MNIPLTKRDLLEQIARETAKLSYPGRMSVRAGTKKDLEDFFATEFPMSELRDNAIGVASSYDNWHSQRVTAIGEFLERKSHLRNPHNDKSIVVAAKFLDTFMHQLMKYEWARPLWKQLHLPLDSIVLTAFRGMRSEESPAAAKIKSCVGTRTAYSISYKEYQYVQDTLWEFVEELNGRPGVEFQVQSRIELNYLWLQ